MFRCFQEHEVRYLVIGGTASVLYGVPRATFDLDILIDPTEENAQRLLDALLDAGMGTASLTDAAKVLSSEITIFPDRVRIDVQTRTPGIEFPAAWSGKVTMNYHGQEFFVVSKADLIASKKAAGRPVVLEDVRLLELGDNNTCT